MKKILALLLLAIMCFTFAGCKTKEVIATSEDLVYATIVYEEYSSSWPQFIWSGKVMTTIIHPAKYEITVEYKGMTETFDDEDFYKANHDRVGKTVAIKTVWTQYDDGSEKTELKLL